MISEFRVPNLPVHRNRHKLCDGLGSCQFCDAGIPRRVMVAIYDHETKTTKWTSMSEELYDTVYRQKEE